MAENPPYETIALYPLLCSFPLLQGWPVNLVTADRVSPLHEACLGGHPSCANILLKHGAQVSAAHINVLETVNDK